MKKILIPTDFSDNAWNAIVYGITLYNNLKCSFYIINVHPVSDYAGGEAAMYISSSTLKESILEENEGKLKQVLKKIERLPANTKHRFQTEAHYGFFTDIINQQVNENKIDLIIMGTKGGTGFKGVSMGSNTGDIITKVPCAVLAVPEDAKYSKPSEIAFPTDFLLGYDTKVMENIKELVVLHNSALRFLYVASKGYQFSKEQQKNRDFLKNYFADITYSFHTLTGKKLDEAVQHFVESRDLDMIVMVAKNLSFLERILFRPRVEKISYHTTVPFLVIHE